MRRTNFSLVLGLAMVATCVLGALFAPRLYPEGKEEWQVIARSAPHVGPAYFSQAAPPSFRHPFGITTAGHNLFGMVLWGMRGTLALSIAATAFTSTVGLIAGLVSGYASRTAGEVLSGAMTMVQPFSSLAMLMFILLVTQARSLYAVVFVIGMTSWITIGRTVRGEVIKTKEMPFVESARAVGAGHAYILLRHILPNIAHSVVVLAGDFAGYAVQLTCLVSFLGFSYHTFGLADLGQLAAAGYPHMLYCWWEAVFPAAAIFLLVLGLNLVAMGSGDVYTLLRTRHAPGRPGR